MKYNAVRVFSRSFAEVINEQVLLSIQFEIHASLWVIEYIQRVLFIKSRISFSFYKLLVVPTLFFNFFF